MTEAMNSTEEKWYHLPDDALLDLNEIELCWLELPMGKVFDYLVRAYYKLHTCYGDKVKPFFYGGANASVLIEGGDWCKGYVLVILYLEFCPDQPDQNNIYPQEILCEYDVGADLRDRAEQVCQLSKANLILRKPVATSTYQETYYLLEKSDSICLDSPQDTTWMNCKNFTVESLIESFRNELPKRYLQNHQQSLSDFLEGCETCKVLLPKSAWISGRVRLNFRTIFAQTSSKFTLLATNQQTPNLDQPIGDVNPDINTEQSPDSLAELRKLADDL